MAAELAYSPNIQPEPIEIFTDLNDLHIQKQINTTIQTHISNTSGNITLSHPIPVQQEQRNRITTIRLLNSAKHCTIPQRFQLHIDGGANRSIKKDYHALLHFKNIRPLFMSSASKENDIKCTGIGYLPWTSTNGTTLLIKCYYSPNAVDETIVSPSVIVNNHITQYHSWTQYANMATRTGTITFTNHDINESIEYPLVAHNGLWYYMNLRIAQTNNIIPIRLHNQSSID